MDLGASLVVFLVTWLSPCGRVASLYQIWCKYLYPVRIY